MDRELVLSVLYDLTLTIGAETRPGPLLRKVLQRLLYHTAFPTGLVVTDRRDGNGDPTGRMATVIGDHLLEQHMGETWRLPPALARPGIELLDDPTLFAGLDGRGNYRHCLKLPIDAGSTILLISPHEPTSGLPLTEIFQPVLANLSRALLLCRNSERLTRTLESDRDRARSDLAVALERSERERIFLRSLNDTIPDLVWLKDPDGSYLACNKAFEALYDATEEQLIGKTDFDFVDRALAEFFRRNDRIALEAGVPSVNEEWLTFASNGYRGLFETIKTPLSTDDGKVIGVLGIARDITRRKAAERAIVEKQKAEATAQAKSQFLANMSHEIRTPLSGILGLAQKGEREGPSAGARALFHQIGASGRHLLQVVNDILDFSKIEAGMLVVERTPISPAASVEHAAGLIRSQAEEKRLRFRVEMAADLPPWIEGDALRLEQILLNLLSNAVKFTERGSVELRVTRDGGNLLFRVSDTGIGMSEACLTQLYKPFEQADSSTTRRFGGTGLGLAISIELAKIMGGDIRAASRLGEGSELSLILPFRPTAPAAPDADSSAEPAGGNRLQGLRLLAAEDVETNRVVLADLLEREGARVAFAENGRQLLELLEQQGASAFDLVLMDVQMPVMDGYEATGRLRETAPGLPVIGLTAHALAEERDRCLAAGMVEHVTKPIDTGQLVAAILRHVAGAPTAVRDEGKTGETVPATTTRPAPTAAPLIDRQLLAERFSGNIAVIDRIIQATLKAYRETPAELRDAAGRRDLDSLSHIAHGLKSVAGNLEAALVRATAVRLEERARAGSDEAAGLAGELAGQLELLLAELGQ